MEESKSASSLSSEQDAIRLIRELHSIELPKFRVVGGIVRYDEPARNSMKDTKQRIVSSLSSQPFGCDNYLIWAPPGSGKSFFIQEIARSMGAHILYRELNLAQMGEQDFRRALSEIEKLDKPRLCFIDEVDSKPSEPWPYEALLPFLEPPANRKTERTCFILAGSSGNSLDGMKENIARRPKGTDLLSRIPPRNEFVIEGLGLGDRLLVVSTQFLGAARESNRHIDEVEKLVLYYVALNPKLKSARQIRQLAVRCIERMPIGEERVKFDYLFDAGDPENKDFWTRTGPLKNEFVNTFVRLEDDQIAFRPSSAKQEISHLEEKRVIEETTRGKNRIAVLPFANISPDPKDEFFADGMTEELISSISKIHGLRVISRTSIMRYKATSKNTTEIGQELQAENLLEGSVRKVGNRLRITVQLIDSKADEHLWSETYDRELQDVFAIQSEISTSVAKALKIRLLPKEKEIIEKIPTKSQEAYTLYLKGRFHFNKLAGKEFESAIEYFQLAIEQDPSFSLAFVGLADSYWYLGAWSYITRDEAGLKAKQFAVRALEIDNMLPDAHLSMAQIHLNYDWDFDAAEYEFRRSIDLNPSFARAYVYHAIWTIYHSDESKFPEAFTEIKRSLELDPLSTVTLTVAASALMYAGHYDEAIEQFKKAISLDPTVANAHDNLGLTYVQKGMLSEGIAEIQKAIELSHGKDAYDQLDLAYALTKAGRVTEGRKIVEELQDSNNYPHVSAFTWACAFSALGDTDKAFEWLERAYTERSTYMYIIVRGALPLDNIRSDERFDALLKRIGLKK